MFTGFAPPTHLLLLLAIILLLFQAKRLPAMARSLEGEGIQEFKEGLNISMLAAADVRFADDQNT